MSSPLPLLQPEAGEARSLSDQAYYRIRELIVSLELPPGSLVDERALMARLEIGRTPVREALRHLARESLVEVHPRRGMFVSSVEVGDLAALSEVRATLESFAAGLAAERRTADDLRETVALLGELDAPGAHDERALIELDQRLHRHVYRCTHNPFLEETLDGYYVLTLRIWFMALDRVARLDEAVHEHRELLEAIRERRLEGGRRCDAASHRRLRACDQGGPVSGALSRRPPGVKIGGTGGPRRAS